MIAARLKGTYLFEDLDADELSRLESICSAQTIAPGDDVFRHGDQADALYVINYGTIRIHREGATVDEIEVTTLGSGFPLGELAWLNRGKRSASATALERTDLTRIDYDGLTRLVQQVPSIGSKMYRALAHRIAAALRETTDDLIFARNINARRV